MSRSYKKTPMVTDQGNKKFGKKYANSIVRQYLKNGGELANGRSYTKLYCSYDICDYKFYETREDVIASWHQKELNKINGVFGWRRDDETLEEALIHWHKAYKAK